MPRSQFIVTGNRKTIKHLVTVTACLNVSAAVITTEKLGLKQNVRNVTHWLWRTHDGRHGSIWSKIWQYYWPIIAASKIHTL